MQIRYLRLGPVSSNASHFASHRISDSGKTTLLEAPPSDAAPRIILAWNARQTMLSRRWRYTLECPNANFLDRVKLIQLIIQAPNNVHYMYVKGVELGISIWSRSLYLENMYIKQGCRSETSPIIDPKLVPFAAFLFSLFSDQNKRVIAFTLVGKQRKHGHFRHLSPRGSYPGIQRSNFRSNHGGFISDSMTSLTVALATYCGIPFLHLRS